MQELEVQPVDAKQGLQNGTLDELLSSITGPNDTSKESQIPDWAWNASWAAVSPPTLTTGDLDLKSAKIMIVDDEPINVKVAKKFVGALRYSDFVTTTNPREAIDMLRRESPDVLLLDVMMPEVSGLDILNEMQEDNELSQIPVIVLTASVERTTRLQALECGATDFLTKPLDPEELAPRIHNTLIMRSFQTHLKKYAADLEDVVRLRTRELCASRLELVHCLARAAEYRDDDTGKHIIRAGRYTALIAREAGMPQEQVDMLEMAAQLHDVGKIGIADSVLMKPGRLTDEERSEMQKHARIGGDMLHVHLGNEEGEVLRHAEIGARILQSTGSSLQKLAATIAMTHHEKWDGSGYPMGLAGTDILLEGRMTAIADVFDALRSKRPYKEPFSFDKSFGILMEGRGKHFDPVLLDHFLGCRSEVEALDIELNRDAHAG